jgi:4-amino-4-deoxy-L-arabinose transferase-like glycosyltransferase
MNARHRPFAIFTAVAGLLLALFLQLTLASSRNSATFDEPAHIYTGYLQWAHGWYTLNPPLTRYIIAAPILGMTLKEPPIEPRPIRAHEVGGGKEFVFENDAEAILFRSRMAVVALALLLALIVFLATREMFGVGAGVIALGLLAFDPTLLAHSSVATTDTGQALFLFWAIYAFYRYVRRPTARRLAVVGIVAGLAVAAKASAVQIFPMLGLLAIVELLWRRKTTMERPNQSTGRQAMRLAIALVVVAAVSFTILWASYGFHYVPADGGVPLVPPIHEKLAQVPSASAAWLLGAVDRLHLLPQAYTYGFAHTLQEARAFTTYVLGTVYPHAVWSFFPVSMMIKSSLTFLILLAVGVWAVFAGRVQERRAILYMTIPAALYLTLAIGGGMNIGVRHVLPVYVFLTAAVAGAAWALIQRNRRWLYVVVALLVFQAASVLHSFPAYIAYANEAFGGPANVHRYLSDSNSDWGQQLKAVKRYVDERGIRDCWIAYFGQGPLDYRTYGIPCKPLVTAGSMYSPAST